MRERTGLSMVVTSMLLAVALVGCGGVPGAPGTPASPGGSFTSSSLPAPPDEPQVSGPPVSRTTTPAAGPVCEDGPLGCRLYRSVGGKDASGELAWLSSQPLELSMVWVNQHWTVGVKTPCNRLGVEVEVNGGTWIPGRRISTAMACLGPESSYETWTHQLFEQPVTWSLVGNSLRLHNTHGSVEFQEAGPILHM